MNTGKLEDRQRGSVTVAAVITLPIIAMVTLIVVQLALMGLARNAATAAAQDGLAAATAFSAPAGAGQAATAEYLNVAVGPLLADPAVSVSTDAGQVTVTVTGHAYRLLTFLDLPVAASQSGPIERAGGLP